MATTSHRALTRVVCRIFIKAAPEAVWDAICPASARYFPDLITIGEVLEADAPGRLVHAVNAAGRDSSDRSGVLSFELRDTLTGYTALTVSCEPAGVPGVPVFGTVGACDWDQLLGDLKTVLEADRRERRHIGPTRSPARQPRRLRSELVPQAQALTGGQLSPARPAPLSAGGAVRVSRHRSRAVAGVRTPRTTPGKRKPRPPGQRKPAASQCAERSHGDSHGGKRGTGARGFIERAGNGTLCRDRRLRCARRRRRS